MSVAVVVGGASCVWDDLERAAELIDMDEATIIACNDIGCELETLHHWVSLHPDKFERAEPYWIKIREENGLPGGYTTWSKVWPFGVRETRHDWVDRVVDHAGGSSAMLGVEVAVELGHTRTLVCGAPMTETPHFHDRKKGKPWKAAEAYREFWIGKDGWNGERERLTWLHDHNVTSMSGWTKALLDGELDGE